MVLSNIFRGNNGICRDLSKLIYYVIWLQQLWKPPSSLVYYTYEEKQDSWWRSVSPSLRKEGAGISGDRRQEVGQLKQGM